MDIRNLAGRRIGQYQLVSLMGAGGMSAVYSAVQSRLEREVAIKVLSDDLIRDQRDADRFELEAKTAAGLEHAHIIPVYDYGSEDGITYVAMRLLKGGTLTERLRYVKKNDQPLPSINEVNSLLKNLADALGYAHSRGIIHRDIKTSNVMFNQQGDPFIVDFGIARMLHTDVSLTKEDVIIGTPTYMAPEQWRGDYLTPAVDQYALAILVYHLLTGELPFDAQHPHKLMLMHLGDFPIPPHELRPEIPDQVTPVLEVAMAKNPEDRFPDVEQFSDAFSISVMGHWDEPTNFFFFDLPQKESVSMLKGSHDSTETSNQFDIDEKDGDSANAAGANLQNLSGQTPDGVEPINEGSISNSFEAPSIEAQGQSEPTIEDLVGQTSTDALNVFNARDLHEDATDQFEVGKPVHVPNPVPRANWDDPIQSTNVATSDEPQRWRWVAWVILALLALILFLVGAGLLVPLVNSRLEATQVPEVAIPEPTTSASVVETNTTDQPVQPPDALDENAEIADATDISADEDVATDVPDDGDVVVAEITDEPPAADIATEPSIEGEIPVTPDVPEPVNEPTTILPGRLVINVPRPLQFGSSEVILNNPQFPVRSVDFSPGGMLASSDSNGNIRVWTELDEEPRNLQGHIGIVYRVQFSPNGRLLASAGDDLTLRLWDISQGQEFLRLTEHRGKVRDIAFSPNGRLLASASEDTTVRIWDVTSGEQLHVLQEPSSRALSVAFSPDGETIATGYENGLIYLWDVDTGEVLEQLAYHAESVRSLAFSPDGKLLASGSTDNNAVIWDLSVNDVVHNLVGHTNDVWIVAFTPDGKYLVSGGRDNTIRLWDVRTGDGIGSLQEHAGWVMGVDFSDDGSQFASASGDGTVRLWNVIQ